MYGNGQLNRASGLDGDIATIVLDLLRDVGRDLNVDGRAAPACLKRAAALLESERSRIEHRTALSRRGERPRGLSPTQSRRVATYVGRHIGRPIAVDELADLTRLAGACFLRSFRESFGMPLSEYVALRRMNLACVLMLTTEEPLVEIASACGVADPDVFAELFFDTFGKPPGVWRSDHRGTIV